MAVAFSCAVFVAYPYVLYPLLLRLLPTRPVRRDPGHAASMSLLFCAVDEAAAMPEKLANIAALKARHPDLEVLAYDDGSSDDTFALLAARPDLVTVERGTGRRGKAAGMARLAARARGEVLVFCDANVLLDAGALDALRAYYADPKVGGVCGTLRYVGTGASPTARVGGFYWRLEEAIKAGESRSGSVMGADGALFSVRRALYPSLPETVLDDLAVSMAVVTSGHRLVRAGDALATERSVVARREEAARKVRIGARAWHTHRHLAPSLRRLSARDRFCYASHKVARWFGGPALIVGTAAAVLSAALLSPGLGLAAAGVVGAGGCVLWRAERGALGALGAVLVALMATGLGVARAMRGEVVVTWAPAITRQGSVSPRAGSPASGGAGPAARVGG